MSDSCCNSCEETGGTCSVEKSNGHAGDLHAGFITEVNRDLRWRAKKNFRPVRKLKFQGLDISIEHDKGMVREWRDRDGSVGQTKMAYPYGYICRTMGADDEQVDVYVGPNKDSDKVFIIHQMAVPDFKRYDEDKVMIGFDSKREAKAAYLMHYDNPKFFGTMTVTDVDAFKRMFVKKALKSSGMKTWKRVGNKHCTTGVCDLLDGVSVPSDEPFPYAKALLGYDVYAPPAHGGCTCTMTGGSGLKRSLNDNVEAEEMQNPMTVPQAPSDGLPMPMEMFVDPHDVETYEGVESLLGRLGGVKDPELMQIAEKIWGRGYNYEGQMPSIARAEILGWLLDQRDLLGVEPAVPTTNDFAPSPSLPVKDPRGSSEYSDSYTGAAPAHAQPSAPMEYQEPSSISSSQPDFSKKPGFPPDDTE